MKRGTIIRLVVHAVLATLVAVPLMRIGSTKFDLSNSKLKIITMGDSLRDLSEQTDHRTEDPYLRAQLRSQENILRRERAQGATLLTLSLLPFVMFGLILWQALSEIKTRRQSNNRLQAIDAKASQPDP